MGTRVRLVLAYVGMTLLWPYFQHSFFRVTFFGSITVFSPLVGFGSFLLIAIIFIALVSLWPLQMERVIVRRSVLFAAVVSSLVGGLLVAMIEGLLSGSFAAVVALVGVAGYSVGFSVLFFAWVSTLHCMISEMGLRAVVTLVVASALLGYLITPTFLSDTFFYRAFPVLGAPLSGLCLALLANGSVPQDSFKPYLGFAAMRRWGILFVAYFVVSLMRSIFFYLDSDSDFSGDTLFSLGALFLFMVLFLVLLFPLGRDKDDLRDKMLWGVVLVSVLVLYGGLLFVSQLDAEDAVLGMSVVFVLMRSLQVCVFVVLLVVSFRGNVSPLPLFGAVFLLTMVSGCVFSYFLAPWWISSFSIDAANSIRPLALGLGFVLVAAFAVFLGFFDPKAEGEKPSVAEIRQFELPDRCSICEAMSQENGMTQREQDVLYYASLGYSARKIGETLFISEHTVHTHSKSVYRKLGVHTKQELIDLVDARCKS